MAQPLTGNAKNISKTIGVHISLCRQGAGQHPGHPALSLGRSFAAPCPFLALRLYACIWPISADPSEPQRLRNFCEGSAKNSGGSRETVTSRSFHFLFHYPNINPNIITPLSLKNLSSAGSARQRLHRWSRSCQLLAKSTHHRQGRCRPSRPGTKSLHMLDHVGDYIGEYYRRSLLLLRYTLTLLADLLACS